MKKWLFALLPFLFAGCAGPGSTLDLAHSWKLFAVDGVSVPADVHSELTFDGLTKINGRAGCNRFFGPVTLKDNTLRAERLGVTMMACPPEADAIEKVVLGTLQQAGIMLHGEHLQLSGGGHVLLYMRSE